MEQDGERHDEHHTHCHRVPETRVMEHITTDLRADHDRDQVDCPPSMRRP